MYEIISKIENNYYICFLISNIFQFKPKIKIYENSGYANRIQLANYINKPYINTFLQPK